MTEHTKAERRERKRRAARNRMTKPQAALLIASLTGVSRRSIVRRMNRNRKGNRK